MHKKAAGWNIFYDYWPRYQSPTVPDGEVLKIFDQLINKCTISSSPRFLILGATWQLRDLACSKSNDVTAVDISGYLLKFLGKLMKNKDKTITANWLDADLPEDHYDFILADYSTSSLDFNEYEKLFQNIKKWLKKDGKLILRQWLAYPFKLQDALNAKTFDEYIMTAEALCTQKDFKCPAKEVYKLHKKLWDKIKDKYDDQQLEVLGSYAESDMAWSIIPKKEFYSLFKKHFNIIEERFAKDNALGPASPIICAQSKHQ